MAQSANARKMFRRAKKVLCREASLLDARGRERLNALVEKSADIRLVHDMQQGLQDIWAKRGGNVEEVIHELMEWCRRAEASGVQTLDDFAATLKSYATPKAAMA